MHVAVDRLAAADGEPERGSLRQRMETARGQLAAGRHASGDRGLRQAIGGFARRGDWAGAVEGALALAAFLLRRGRAREAKATLDAAREHGRQLSCAGPLAPLGPLATSCALATLSGIAYIDLGRLDEAEGVLGPAAAATCTNSRPGRVGAALALARCRFWRGQYAEADAVLAGCGEEPLDEATIVRLHAMRARIAVGRVDLAGAIALAAEAVRRAELLDDSGSSPKPPAPPPSPISRSAMWPPSSAMSRCVCQPPKRRAIRSGHSGSASCLPSSSAAWDAGRRRSTSCAG
jgi:hypothetical protein